MSENKTVQFNYAKTRKYKDGRVLDVSYKEIVELKNGKVSIRNIENKDSYGDFIHPDLENSLKAFLPHFLLVAERANINDFTPSYFKKKDYLKKKYDYEVTGIHIKDQNGIQNVILVGRQVLKNGRVISMTPPMINFDIDESEDDVNKREDFYPFHKELKAAVHDYLTECERYLQGHHGKSAQQTMNLEDAQESDDEKVRKIS